MSDDPIVEAVKADAVVQAVLESEKGGDRRAPAAVVTQAGEMVAKPTTTEEENRTTAGQREVSLMWENTQRQIALAVIAVALSVAAFLSIASETRQGAATVFLYGVANLVIGFYFGRTNHQKVGGVVQGR